MMTSSKRRYRLAVCLLMLLGLLASPAIAQPPPPLPQVGDSTNDAVANEAPEHEPDVRRLYVPTAQLDAVLRGDKQGVLLPRGEFRQLYEAARAAEESAVHSPGGIIVTSAQFAARLADEQMQLTATVQLTQFDAGWQVVRLPLAGLSLQSATLDGQPAAVARDGKQRSVLLLFSDAPGQHTLSLKLTTPLNAVGSDRLAEFQTLAAPAGLLTLEVPEGKTLLVDGLKQSPEGEQHTDDADSDEDTPQQYRIALGGRGRVSLRLTDRDLRHAADALVFANTAYGLQVAPGEVTWSTQTAVQAWGQSLSQLTFTVPRDLEVASVESTGLEEWTLGETGGRRSRTQITLNYRQPFEGERIVTIRGVLVPDGEEWTVPNLVLQDADSHAATIVVRHGPDVRLQSDHGEDVRPVTSGEPQTLEFLTMDSAFDLEFRTLGKARSVQVAQTNLLDIGDDGLDLHVVMDVDTYFVPLFDVRVLLPADFEVTTAVVGDKQVKWTIANGPPGIIEVRIPLDPPLAAGESGRVQLSAHADPEDWPVENAPVLLPFPEVQLPQADMVEARYGIIADADLDVRTAELSGLDPARQADVQGLQQAARQLGRSLRLGFSYQDTVFSGQLEVARKPTRLAVSTLALSRLDPQMVHTGLQAFVTVEGGGTEGLLIELPEATGTDLRFSVRPATPLPANVPASGMPIQISQTVAIVEQTVSDPAAGVRTWALKFDRRMRGNHVLQVTLNQPRTTGEDVTLPAARFVGAERQNGWIAVEARPEQNLQVQAVSADTQPLLRVDPIDLPGVTTHDDSQRRIVAGVRYVRPGYTVTVSEQTFDPRAVPTALADRMTTTSVLSQTGRLQHQLDVAFRAVGMQSLRFVLPAGADVWAVLVDGQPVEVRQAQDTYQVPLESGDDPAAERSLRLIYRSQPAKTQLAGRLQQSPPVVEAVSGSGQTERLEVLQQSWTLHYPDDVVLLTSHGLLAPTNELVQDNWLADIREAITLPTLTEAGWRVGIAAGIAVVIAGLVLLVRKLERTSSTALLMGMLACAVVAFVGFLFYSFAAQEVASSGYIAESTAAGREADAMDSEGGFAAAADEATPTAGGFGGGGFGGGGAAPTLGNQAGMGFEQAVPPPTAEPQRPSRAAGPLFQPQAADDLFAPPGGPQLGTPIGPAGQQAVPQQAAEDFAGGRPASGTVTMVAPPARGALLSLSLDLEAPEGSRSQTFETLASDTDQAAPLLDVSYGSRTFREVIVLCLAAGLALLMWLLRDVSLRTRLAIVLATIVVPLAVAPITPGWLTMIVEGVLLGGIAGAALWLLRALITAVCTCCGKWCPRGWTTKTSPGTSTGVLLAAALLSLGSAVQAQDTSPAESKPEAAPATEADERPTVVVPYEGEDPLAAERVFLPQELFRKLWLQAHPDQRPRAAAPVDALVAEALYVVDLTDRPVATTDGQAEVRVQGRLVLFGLADKAVWLPLPLQQVAIARGTLDGKAAVLRPGKSERPEVLIDAGLHVLDLEFDLPAVLRDTSGELSLPLLPVAAGSLSLTLPRDDAERDIRVRADGRQVVGSRVTTTDDAQQIDVAVDQGGPLQINWQPQAQSGGTDNIVHVTTRSALDIGDAGVQMIADYQLQVRQGVLSRVPFAFPESVRLKRITGADVGGWQIEGEGDQRTLTIFLRRNVDDATTITAELFLPQADRSDAFDVDVPGFAPLQVTRETGEVSVVAGSHLEVRAAAVNGLRQIDRGEAGLPQSLVRAEERVQLAYRFVTRPWSLQLEVEPEVPEMTARAEHGVSIGLRKTRYASRFVFTLSGAPRRTQRIMVGDEFLLTSVAGEAIADWFVEAGELVLDFGQPRTGRIDVLVEGHLPRNPADTSAVIITPLPTELDRQDSLLAVWIDPVYAATLDAFETWRTIDRAQLPAELRQLQSAAPQFAFTSAAAEPEIINLNVVRQQPQITADAVTLIALSDVSVDYGLTLRWTIERAATDLLAFTVPAWLQDRLEITGQAIRQTTQTVTDDGRVRWTVQLTDAVRGEYLLSAIATLPPPEDNQIAAPDVLFEQPAATSEGLPTPLEAQQTFAVLVNLSRGRLTPAGDFETLAVRRQQLPLVLRDDLLAQAMAIVRIPPQRNLVWNLQRVTEEATQAAQVSAAELTTVLALDGSLRTHARYRVRNRGQQYLALQLPESARLLSVLVKGEPARGLSAEIGDVPVTLIPLPQTSAADLSFLVDVVLADHLAGATRLDAAALGRVLDLPAPQVISARQSPEFGMPVVHTSWTVWLPEDFDAEINDSRVRGTPRSNLTPQPARAAQVLSELQLYRELEDLNRLVVDEKATAAQRSKAASNLDLLQKRLRSQRSSGQSYFDRLGSLVPQDRDFAEQTDELLEESARNVKQAQQELLRGGTVIIVEDPANTNYLGKSFIVGNSAQIITDNAGSGIVQSEQQFNRFSLDSKAGESKPAAAKSEAAGKPTDSRSLLRGKLLSQQLALPDEAAPNTNRRFEKGLGIGGGGALHGEAAGRSDFVPPQVGLPGQAESFGTDSGAITPVTSALAGAPAEWLETGGLSLPIDLPAEGQSLTFTKLGGEPRLALDVRPRETAAAALHWAWALVVLAAGAWLLHHLAHRTDVRDIRAGLIALALTLGLVGLLCLPAPLSLAGAALFIAGAVFALLTWNRAADAAHES